MTTPTATETETDARTARARIRRPASNSRTRPRLPGQPRPTAPPSTSCLDEELLEDIAGPRTRRPRHYCSCRKRWVSIPTRRVIRLPYRRLSGHCGSSFGTFSRVCANVAPTPSAALTRGQTSLPGGLSVVCGRGKAPSKISGTLVALAAHDKMSVPLELSDLSRNQLWRQIRGFSRSPLGKASTKGKLRSDPSAPAHRHKLAVFPHQVSMGTGDRGKEMMDATRTRRTRDRARQTWYARWRQQRFARFLGFASGPSLVVSPTAQVRPGLSK